MGIVPGEERRVWLVAHIVDSCVETAGLCQQVCPRATHANSTRLILVGEADLLYPAISDLDQLGYWEEREGCCQEHCWKYWLLCSCRSVLQQWARSSGLDVVTSLAGESKLSAQRCLDVCPTAL